MGVLSSFALGLAVNIVHDFIKSKMEPGLKKDIDNAFEESLRVWSVNETIRKDKKSYLKENLEKQFQKRSYQQYAAHTRTIQKRMEWCLPDYLTYL